MAESLEELGLVHAASIELAAEALIGIEHDYDEHTGVWPHKRHNQHHTRTVIHDAMTIGALALERDKITERTLHLLRIAAAFHDRFYKRGLKDESGNSLSERISAYLAMDAMSKPEYEFFTDEDKDAVGRYIMATVVTSFWPRIQNSPDTEYDYAEGLLADADLAMFGNKFWPFMRDSWNEFEEIVKQPGISMSHMKFLFNEETLLRNHTWHTDEAKEQFTGIGKNIQALIPYRDRFAVQ